MDSTTDPSRLLGQEGFGAFRALYDTGARPLERAERGPLIQLCTGRRLSRVRPLAARSARLRAAAALDSRSTRPAHVGGLWASHGEGARAGRRP